MTEWLVVVLTISEVALLGLVAVFFARLRKSENLLTTLRDNQDKLLQRIQLNAELEEELVSSFAKRQKELGILSERLEEQRDKLQKLLSQAEEFSRSPHFLRQIILSGKRKGQSSETLARATGLSVDEVELILEQGE